MLCGKININTRRRKFVALVVALIFFTKIGVPNLLYVLQYADCILRLLLFKKRIKYASNTAIYKSRVHVYDIDWWYHMNNAAYLRHAELARVDFFIRTQIWEQLKRKGCTLAFVAVNTRYRRELRIFQSYEIHTRALFWDSHTLVIEQRFIHPHTQFLHAIVYGKYVACKNGKKMKGSITNSLDGDGIHLIRFYEKPLINPNVGHNAHEMDGDADAEDLSSAQPLVHVSSMESMSSAGNGFIEHKDGQCEPEMVAQFDDTLEQQDIATFVRDRNEQNLSRSYYNTFECRNKIPRSLRIWLQALEQSSYESRRNLL